MWNLDGKAIQNNCRLVGADPALPIGSGQGGRYFHWAE